MMRAIIQKFRNLGAVGTLPGVAGLPWLLCDRQLIQEITKEHNNRKMTASAVLIGVTDWESVLQLIPNNTLTTP